MSDPRAPWWYSGSEESGSEESGSDAPVAGPMDWTALAAGAQRLVDWATERVMAPHAEHVDPAAHPQCVVCRTLLVIGDRSGTSSGEPTAETRPTADDIAWIPIVGERPEP